MNAAAFCAEYLPETLRESPGERRAVELWAWYHVTCEAYDRSVCHEGIGPDGGAIPFDDWERSLIVRNAAKVLREVANAAARDGVTPAEMAAGHRRVQWMRLDDMAALAVPPVRAYDHVERAREKEESRRRDEEALASGEKTREELRRENGFFSALRWRIDLAGASRRA